MYIETGRKKAASSARLENSFKNERKPFNPRLEIYSNAGPTCHRCQNTGKKKVRVKHTKMWVR